MDLSSGGERLKRVVDRIFVDREILFRTSGRLRYFTFRRRTQVALFALFLATAGWVTYVTTVYFGYHAILAAKDRETEAVRRSFRAELAAREARLRELVAANGELRRQAARDAARIAEISERLAREKARLAAAAETRGELERTIAALDAKLAAERAARAEIDARRRELAEGLDTAEGEMEEMARRNSALHDEIAGLQNKLDTAEKRIALMTGERTRLAERLAEMEQRFADLHDTQAEVLARLIEETADKVARIEESIAQAGIDPNEMIGDVHDHEAATLGQGGPFIALVPEFQHPPDFDGDLGEIDPQADLESKVASLGMQVARLEGLNALLRSLPMVSPVDQYRVASAFGPRKDPITRKPAMHLGVDMSGYRKTPILAPAPGTVVFAGRNGNYGKSIVIDHGNGIRTRYGHLARILVKKGQRVEFGDMIARMGSTGRSTGTHLHYEIIVNGRPVDPMKFIKAGRYVLQG